MPQKQVIKTGYLLISDHLALGVTLDKLEGGEEEFKYFKFVDTQFVREAGVR